MFVTLDLPMTIIRGENYCFTATIFSYYDYTIPVSYLTQFLGLFS